MYQWSGLKHEMLCYHAITGVLWNHVITMLGCVAESSQTGPNVIVYFHIKSIINKYIQMYILLFFLILNMCKITVADYRHMVNKKVYIESIIW